MAITRKALDAFVAPHFKAAVRYANNHCVHFTPNPVPAGVVVSHGEGNPKAGEIQFEGYTIEISMCRRARVVCGVPTPFSLYTFNYCLKRDGKQLAHGMTKPEFLDHAMRAIKKEGF